MNLAKQIKLIPAKFWLLQSIQMVERLVYSALVLQMAVYIAQKDILGGLNLEHTDKGIIFFFWALVQNLTPVFSGAYIDKYGRKKFLIISIIITAIGLVLTASQDTFYGFLFSVLIVGFGLGLYRPTIYGMLALQVKNAYSAVAWGVNVMLVNFAVFFAPSLAKYLQEISWYIFFISLAVILLVSIIPILFVRSEQGEATNINNLEVLKITFKELLSKKIISIILILSGFMMIYMQFYETLPNFIFDWIDTSSLVERFSLPKFMTMDSMLGTMVDFKWLYALNSGFIVLAVVFVSWVFSNLKKTTVLLIGIAIVSIGILISGWSMSGDILVAGMLIYTLGEMITNPKFTEFMASLAPEKSKSMYMGFINVSMAIGLAGGSLLGGFLYKNFGEKSGLAIKYLDEFYSLSDGINHQNAINILMEKTGLDPLGATQLLWNEYNPHYFWFIFAGIGLLSAISLIIYAKKYKI